MKFGTVIAANLRRTRPKPSDHWHLDEMVIVIQRKRYWLWRAVDNEGEVWTHPGNVEASYAVCIASASNLTGLVNASVECRRSGL